MKMCVYAIAARSRRSPPSPRARGVARERLLRQPMGRLEVVTGDVRTIPAATTANLVRYGRVQMALWRDAAAMLPARFGTIVADRAELETLLRGREAALLRQLRAVRGRAQMTVRILAGASQREDGKRRMTKAPADRQAGGKSRGTSFLRAKAAQARDVPEFDPVRGAVRRWVKDERVNPQRGSFSTVYHLVPRSSADTYRGALLRAARERGVRLLVSGPWPPYAFAEEW